MSANINTAEQLFNTVIEVLLQSECVFYYSLIITAVYTMSFRLKNAGIILNNNLRQLKKWAESCKENFEDIYLLVSAEVARITEQKEQAMYLYDKAIQSAREYRHTNNEAIANELAAIFYLSTGLHKIAKAYMVDACKSYRLWGAYTKVKQIKSKYPDITEEITVEVGAGNDNKAYTGIRRIDPESSDSISTSGNNEFYYLDKIIENIYSEPDINKLLIKFIDIAIQSIGANKGYLILEKSGSFILNRVKITVPEELLQEVYP